MSELRKMKTNYPYFVTCTVVGWIDVFTRKCYCDLLSHQLSYYIEQKGLELFAYVIMPSHIHLVLRDPKGNLPGIIRDFKSGTSRRIIKHILDGQEESRWSWLIHMFKYHARFRKQNNKFMFWQKTSHPIELNYPKIIDQKVQYIHLNPVRAGYVNYEQAWCYSSANPFQKLRLATV